MTESRRSYSGKMMVSPEWREKIRAILVTAGACRVGFAKAEAVENEEWMRFVTWIDSGKHAGMSYMLNYPEIRRDPRGLLEGAGTVISLAFSYHPVEWRDDKRGMIASYAYGNDYHKVIRKILKPVLGEITELWKVEGNTGNMEHPEPRFRICVDSAPILERYWACRAGVGYRGDNGCVIVPGFGSMVFLAEIVTDLKIEPDRPLSQDCGHCGACREVCPGDALGERLDCRRCLSYLTIEHQGEVTETAGKRVMASKEGRNTIFGCDLCLRVCGHNKGVPATKIEAFALREDIKKLGLDEIAELRSAGEEGDKIIREHFAGSPILRGILRRDK